VGWLRFLAARSPNARHGSASSERSLCASSGPRIRTAAILEAVGNPDMTVPAIYHLRSFTEAGGLISYGADDIPVLRQTGIYAGQILNGAKPGDLPVQEPTTFELVINRKTAASLGLTLPPSVLARADEIIE